MSVRSVGRIVGYVSAGAMVWGTLGCAPPRQGGGKVTREQIMKEMPPPPRPPAVPARQAVALDPALRERAKEQVYASARSPDVVMRSQAIEAAQLGLGAEGADLILGGLNDPRPLPRFAGAMAAGSIRLEAARGRLVELADDADANVRVAVRFALHRLGDTSRSRDLEQYSVAPEPIVRRNTVMALGLLGEKSAVRVLWPMQNDPDASIRLQVSEALWRLGNETGLENLVAGVVSQFPDDQIVASLALAATGDERMRPYLRGKLTTPWDEVNLAAARALGMIGSDEGYGVAQRGARSADPRQRAMAALAFGAIGRPDAQPELSRLLGDPEESVRLAAALGILQVHKPRPGA